MSSISETILTNSVHPGDSTTVTVTGDKYKGDGFYGRADGFHTVQYNVAGFNGTLKMQGTLAVSPVDTDYFDIAGTAWGPKKPSYQPKIGSTGVAVRLVYNLLENRIN